MISSSTKLCGVFFLNDGTVLVEGVDYEPTGPGGLTSNARELLPSTVEPEALGQTVLAVLDQTKVVNGADYDERKIIKERLRFVGAKSNRQFEASAKHSNISWEGSRIEVTPSIYEAANGGWYRYLEDQSATCMPEANALGALLLRQRQMMSD